MRSLLIVAPRCARLRSWVPMSAVAVVVATMAAAPGVAGAQQCPEAKPTYFDACGPTFVVPAWGDAGGWTDPSKYSTIQLADFNGDGKDELLARNDQGLEIYWFDTTLGQWRPQVDADDLPQVLTDFRSPLPNETPATDWTKAEYYSTIQAADIDGQPGAEILARFSDGMHVYKYAPPTGTNTIDGGSWRTGTGGPFSDAGGYADPSLYSTIHVGKFRSEDAPLMFARTNNSYLSWYEWSGGTWTRVTRINALGEFDIDGFADPACALPACYLDLKTGNVGAIDPDAPDDTEEVLGRLGFGVSLWDIDVFNSWGPLYGGLGADQLGAFADVPGPLVYTGLPDRPGDCPFSARGASGAGSGDCLGSSPSYYETLQAADIDGKPGDELLARASDGLRVRTWDPGNQPPPCCEIQPHLDALPTLTALGGAASSVQPGAWGSIRTGDINGDQRDEVLALDANGLEAYNYAPSSQTWTQLPGSLGLTGDWLTDPASYATIQVGDVDGDGKDDVVARGPYGIRTWFYNRRGTGGWERYLSGGYPAFQGGHSGASGYQNGFDAFNKVAAFDGDLTKSQSSVRDVWTQANASSAADLTNLQQDLTNLQNGILRFAGCVEPPNPGSPLSYQSCARPSNAVLSQAGVQTDSTGVPINNFDAVDWTWVVNEVLAEIAMAQAVVEHFVDVNTMREGVFESETNALPAIGNDLQLAGAANNTTSFSFQNMFAGASGIAASLAGLIPGEGAVASAGMWVASELASMLPSASATATSTFQTTYAGLLTKLATAQDEMATALSSQTQQVFADQGLRDLVGQLRSRGTWIPDTDGMQSASRQAFSLETYQALLPTMYSRWVVTGCTTNDSIGLVCKDLPSGSDVVGRTSTSAIWLGPTTSGTCTGGYDVISCDYGQNPGKIPDSIANIVWGPVSDTCNYQPPNKNTLWTYGCSLGVPTATSIGADSPGWSFANEIGNPIVGNVGGAARATRTVVRAGAARVGPSAQATQGGSGARAARDRLGPLRFRGRVSVPRGLRLRRARVVVARTLYEHGRREELARSGSGRRLRPFALEHVRGGLFTARRRGALRVRLQLRRLDAGAAARVDLRLTRARIRDIRPLCTVLPASVHLVGRPLELETRLRLRDGTVKSAVTLRQRWRCVRDRKGEFTGIRPIKPRRPAARPGLAVRLGAPRVSASGRRATVLVTVVNQRRRRPSRVVSSLWDLRVTGGASGSQRSVGFKRLRAGRSRTVRLTVPVPRRARERVCVRVAANAASARGAIARRCARVAGRPRAGCSAAANAACVRAAKPQRAARARPRRVPRDRSGAQR
jgi:FG-GAP-like repeat